MANNLRQLYKYGYDHIYLDKHPFSNWKILYKNY